MKWAEKFKWYDAFVIFFLLDHLPLALMCNFRVVSTSCSILHRVSLFIMIIVMCVRAHLFIHFICEQMRTRASIYLSSSKLPANRPSLTFITLSNFFQCNPFHPMPVFFYLDILFVKMISWFASFFWYYLYVHVREISSNNTKSGARSIESFSRKSSSLLKKIITKYTDPLVRNMKMRTQWFSQCMHHIAISNW